VRARVTRFSKPHETETEDEPDLELDKLGFERPEMIAEMADRWALGGIAATRDQRARRKFKALTPIILQKLSSSSEPDEAALQFDRFMSGLPTGVQLFSLFEANPQLLDLLVEICAVAPKLAEHLARNSAVLDAVLDADFFAPMPVSAEMTADLCLAINDDGDDFEAALNTARRWAKEMKFRLGVQVLRGVADGCEAGRGFSAIAEACLIALKPVVEADFARRHGPPPGRGAAVIAMGKLGSREMTASSDLDLIVIYDAAGETESTGVKPLTMQVYFARLTQKLVSALTAPTSEGMLYEVDMRLRPSGGQGPVAIGLAGFQNYQMNEAWTWEHMALTRARVIAGEETLATELTDTIASVLAAPRDAEKTRADVAEMRGRLEAAHGAARDRLWALKQARGGLMDVEFAAQCGLLSKSVTGARSPETSLPLLVEKGAISADDASALIAAYSLQSHLQHVERIAHAGAFQADEAGEGLKAALARIGEANDFDELDVKLGNLRTVAADVVDRVLGEA
jgi:glutamate-ammonia-ligase adenylyltransferase